MSTGTAAQQGQQGAEGDDPGRAAVDRAAAEKSLDPAQERSALDYLLGTPKAAIYKVEAQYETPEGKRPLVFHFRAMDGRKIDRIEQAAINQATGQMDKITADAELVAAATTKIEDPEAGAETTLDERFRTLKEGEAPLASPVDALLARFGTQIGLLAGVASAIREAAGWDRDRVGKASRVLVSAAGN